IGLLPKYLTFGMFPRKQSTFIILYAKYFVKCKYCLFIFLFFTTFIKDVIICAIPGDVISSLRDLGVTRTSDAKFSSHSSDVVAKATRMCGVIRRIFRSNHRNILWPAFPSFVLPLLTYCSPIWRPYL